MNKKLVPILVIIVILAAGGYYLKTKKTDGSMTSNQIISEASEFARAMESGKPTVCTMKKGDDIMEYLIKGKSMRMNSTTTMTDEAGKTTTAISHMINDTKYLYMWDDKTKQGSKMAIPTEEEIKAMSDKAKQYESTAPQLDSESDYQSYKDQGYTINCKASSIDDSAFIPPSDIKFFDPTEMMKAIPSPDAEGNFDMSQLEELQKKYDDNIKAKY